MDLCHCNLFLGGALHQDISALVAEMFCAALERCARVLACLGQRVLTYPTDSRAQRMWIYVGASSLTGIVQLNGRQFPSYRLKNDRCVPESGSPSTQPATYDVLFLGHVTIRVCTTLVGLESQAANCSEFNCSHGCGRS